MVPLGRQPRTGSRPPFRTGNRVKRCPDRPISGTDGTGSEGSAPRACKAVARVRSPLLLDHYCTRVNTYPVSRHGTRTMCRLSLAWSTATAWAQRYEGAHCRSYHHKHNTWSVCDGSGAWGSGAAPQEPVIRLICDFVGFACTFTCTHVGCSRVWGRLCRVLIRGLL